MLTIPSPHTNYVYYVYYVCYVKIFKGIALLEADAMKSLFRNDMRNGLNVHGKKHKNFIYQALPYLYNSTAWSLVLDNGQISINCCPRAVTFDTGGDER
jgi:hypothetical protein